MHFLKSSSEYTPATKIDSLLELEFCNEYSGITSKLSKNIVQKTRIVDFVGTIIEILRRSANEVQQVNYAVSTASSDATIYVYLKKDDKNILIVSIHSYVRDHYETARHGFIVMAVGKLKIMNKFNEYLKELPSDTVSKIEWNYMNGKNLAKIDFTLDPPEHKIHNEFYPWLKQPIHEFYEDFKNSTSSLLFMFGPAGTGKTSFIRHLLSTSNKKSMVSYDDDLLESDAMFTNFMSDPDIQFLIIEDADLLVSSREHHGNKLVSRFLNVSDGLIKMKNKKIIFTTNLDNTERVDPALVRRGRCYDVLKFRALTYEEAITAAKVAELKIPTVDRPYLLTELFNQGNNNEKMNDYKVGFHPNNFHDFDKGFK